MSKKYLFRPLVNPLPESGLVVNIEALTDNNSNFRRVIYTSHLMQIVVMSVGPGQDIGEEVHEGIDQFLRVESGQGIARLGNDYYMVGPGDAIVVPYGTLHDIINTSTDEPLKLYAIYTPPKHKPGLTQRNKPKE